MKLQLIEKDRAKEINTSLEDCFKPHDFYRWDWIVREWYKRLQELDVEPRHLFLRKEVCGRPFESRDLEFTWGNIKEEYGQVDAEEKHVDFQEELDEEPYPGVSRNRPYDLICYPEWRIYNKGVLRTLFYLWEARDKIDLICAVLICASYFNGLNSYLDTNSYDVDKRLLFRIVRHVVDKSNTYCDWHNRSSSATPQTYDYLLNDKFTSKKRSIRSFRMLVRAYAEDHAYLLKDYRPVYYVRVDKRIPDLDKKIEERNKKREINQFLSDIDETKTP